MNTIEFRYRCFILIVTVCSLLVLGNSAQGSQPPGTGSPETPQTVVGPKALPSPLKPQAAAVATNPTQELLEYQLAEKVEKRVMSSLRTLGALLGVVIAVAAFFGASLILDYLSRRVEKQVANRLQEDLGFYRKRLQENLVELEMSAATQKELAGRVKRELENLENTNRELQQLQKQYTDLHDEVSTMRDSIQEAVSRTAQAQQNTEQLREAVAESAAGKPAVFGREFHWETDERGSLTGKNFGAAPGRLYVQLSIQKRNDKSTEVLAEPLLIDAASITDWSDTHISFVSYPELRKQVKIGQSKLSKKLPGGDQLNFEYIVEQTRVVG